MKYYIAADGGGTKLMVILYDEKLHIINSVVMSGTNDFFRTREEMAGEFREKLRKLIPKEIQEIECVDVCILKYGELFLETLGQLCRWKSFAAYTEGTIALAAAGFENGVVAVAGTGSSVFLIRDDMEKYLGGWGFVLGDEGSGYDIGLQALKAVLCASENRGPRTLLTNILLEEWKVSEPRNLIWKVMEDADYKKRIVSVSRLAAKAAARKDAVALEIYERAGRALAGQVLALLHSEKNPDCGPVVAAGGAWKGCGRMFEVFRAELVGVYPEVKVCRTVFEPVVGCVVRRCFKRGFVYEDIEGVLGKEFQSYRIG